MCSAVVELGQSCWKWVCAEGSFCSLHSYTTISLFMGSSCHLGLVEETAWLMQDKSFLSIWSLRISSMAGALWRTLTFSEDVRHNLATLCLCSKMSIILCLSPQSPNLFLLGPWQTSQSTALDSLYTYTLGDLSIQSECKVYCSQLCPPGFH